MICVKDVAEPHRHSELSESTGRTSSHFGPPRAGAVTIQQRHTAGAI